MKLRPRQAEERVFVNGAVSACVVIAASRPHLSGPPCGPSRVGAVQRKEKPRSPRSTAHGGVVACATWSRSWGFLIDVSFFWGHNPSIANLRRKGVVMVVMLIELCLVFPLFVAVSHAVVEDCDDALSCPSPWEEYCLVPQQATAEDDDSEQEACDDALGHLKGVLAGAAGHACCECEVTLRDCRRDFEHTSGTPTCSANWNGETWIATASFTGCFKVKCRQCYSAGGGHGY